jgi:hypothetical protein
MDSSLFFTALLIVILVSCTPMTSAMKSSQSSAQDSKQNQDSEQGQGMAHQSRTSDMPIIIICNHVGTGDSSCVHRSVPGNEFQNVLK